MTTKNRTTSDARAILDRRHPATQSDLDMRAAFRQEVEVAELIYEARTAAGLSQRELAKLVGTTASVICRLEDADYDGHSMAMLRRIAAVLHKRVELRFVDDDRLEMA